MSMCPICFNTSLRSLRQDFLHGDNFFMSCRNCGHGFCSKSLADYQDTSEQLNQNLFYDIQLSEYEKVPMNLSQRSADQWCKLFQKYASGKSLLEIGCGPGTFLK